MELQPRDISILEVIGELGTADTKILHGLFFPDKTAEACQKRLKKITDAGLLKTKRLFATDGYKVDGSLAQNNAGGSTPNLFFLTELGGDLVLSETGILPRRITRSDPKQLTLRHRMEIVRARMAIDKAADILKIPAVNWIMEQDNRVRAKAKKGRSPNEDQILNDRFFLESSGRTVAFRPDASFHLQVPRPSGDGFKSLLGYIELDRSTEGHLQWEGKLQAIEAFFEKSTAWKNHWPDVKDPTVILFVICKTNERMGNLAVTTRSSSVANRTRIATYPLDPQAVLTGDVWQDCEGELKRIIRST